jgi:sarcosine oxidase subunit beta
MKPNNNYDVIVIGGGIIGSSTALNLSLRNRRVLILEKKIAGQGASGVNAGGVRRMNRDVAEIPLAVESMELWYGLESMTGADCGFKKCGQLMIAETEAEMGEMEKRVALTRSLGWDHEELINREELKKILPMAAGHCKGAMIARDDGAAEPFLATNAIYRAALKNGAAALEHTLVQALEHAAGDLWRVHCGVRFFEAPMIVNCAGAWGARVAGMVGDRVPVHAEAPTMMVTARVAPFLTPVVSLKGRRLSFKQTRNGSMLIGGGYRSPLDMETEKAELSFAELKIAAQTVTDLFPHMRGVPVVRSWNGIEGVTPDHIPIISPSSDAPGIFHAIGFSAHGFQLGPIVGKIMADLVIEGSTSLPIDPFHISRFCQ